MKIGDSISTYYRSQTSQAPSGGPAGLTPDSASQRTQAPSISIGTGASPALSSALWISMADKQEESGLSGASAAVTRPADEFMQWAKMTPAEKVRAQILESQGLSEEDLQNMTADQRKAIEADIKDAVLKQLGLDDKSGTSADPAAETAA